MFFASRAQRAKNLRMRIALALFLCVALNAFAGERKLTNGTLLLPESPRPAPAVILTKPDARELAKELVSRGIAVLLASEQTDLVVAARELAWQREIRSGDIALAGAANGEEVAKRARRTFAFTFPEADVAKISAAMQKRIAKSSAIPKELEAFNRAMEDTVRRGEMAAVANFYAADGEVRGPGLVIRGREDLTAYWAGVTDAKDWKLEVLETGGSRDEPWQRGRSILRTAERDHAVDFVLLFKRNASGKLEIVLDFYY